MSDFDYKLVKKNDITILTISGLIDSDCKERLEKCREQVLEDKAKLFIIYFKDVPKVEPGVFRIFTLLQHDIRKKNSDLFLTGLDERLKKYLTDRAVIRLGEVKRSLSDILELVKRSA